MKDIFSRTSLLIGEDSLIKLKNKNVALFGLGGVGSYVFESLVRCGIGKITIVDKDVVDETNINRQLIALYSTIGKPKTEVAKMRGLDINPDARIDAKCVFFGNDNAEEFNFEEFDYIIDAIDCVTSKLVLIDKAKKCGTPIISCMGTGGKINPSLFEVTDIKKTHSCPLAKVMRKELKDRGIENVKVVFSPEIPVKSNGIIPSISFVPSSAGLLIASEVVKDLIK